MDFDETYSDEIFSDKGDLIFHGDADGQFLTNIFFAVQLKFPVSD